MVLADVQARTIGKWTMISRVTLTSRVGLCRNPPSTATGRFPSASAGKSTTLGARRATGRPSGEGMPGCRSAVCQEPWGGPLRMSVAETRKISRSGKTKTEDL